MSLGRSIALALIFVAGCSRTHYRRATDAETYGVLDEKIAQTPFAPPGFTIEYDPRSRMFAPVDPDYAPLPLPGPALYTYQIPPLTERPQSPGTAADLEHPGPAAEKLPLPPADFEMPPAVPPPGAGEAPGEAQPDLLPPGDANDQQAAHGRVADEPRAGVRQASFNQPPDDQPPQQDVVFVDDAAPDETEPADNIPPPDDATPPDSTTLPDSTMPPADDAPAGLPVGEPSMTPIAPSDLSLDEGSLPIAPIPRQHWEAIEPAYLARMLELERVRQEYLRTYQESPAAELSDEERLSLEDIVELALINSREYQAQKEQLYRSALALTLERFDYALKFSPLGNGTDLNYGQLRSNGLSNSTLGVPSSLQVDRALAGGGTLLTRFANDVLLTFNGPDGFASDISSEMFFNFSQALIQRDVRFEPLTQAERNVIYAARTYGRFRKSFFFQLTSDYYALIRTYRQIEIESQNYFSLVRALSQAEAEFEAGLRSRIQVEQIEQSMLQGRSRLIATSVGLERSLDRLKLVIGIPTELPINLDLQELADLTLRDEASVSGETVRRTRDRLQAERARPAQRPLELINAAIVLTERMSQRLAMDDRLGRQTPQRAGLELLRQRLRLAEARLNARVERAALDVDAAVPETPPLRLLQRSLDVVGSLLDVVARQVELIGTLEADLSGQLDQRAVELGLEARRLRDELAQALAQARLDELPELLEASRRLQESVERLVADADTVLVQSGESIHVDDPDGMPEGMPEGMTAQIDQLLASAGAMLQGPVVGLVPVEIAVDDAMLTALARRLDLMNERGFVADERRALKLAADELRSVLNLSATQVLASRQNRPLDFSLDDSRTEVGLSLDLPLNRKAQRNLYRLTLIDYQVALRRLMQVEDNIKLAVRDDLRDLALARAQYQISVASAALAAERVASTQLELALGFPGVAARDYLEAQDAFRVALGGVADNHIGYTVNRTRFFLNLELLEVDADGFWRQLRDEQFQPEPQYEFAPQAGPPYGRLPPWLKYSREMRRVHPD